MRLTKSFGYAWKGLLLAMRSEPNLRIHFVVLALVVLAGFYFGIATAEWAVLLLAAGLVIAMELINTAIEHLADLMTIAFDPRLGKVKDIAAAAVLISALTAVITGVVIFSKYIF